MIISLVCEHVCSEEKWVPSLFGYSNQFSQVPVAWLSSFKNLLRCIFNRIPFEWPTAAGHQQKVSTVTVKLEGKIRRAAAKTASSRAPLQRSHCTLAHGICLTNASLLSFLIFESAGCPFAFQIKRGHCVLSIWLVLFLGWQLYCWVQMPPSASLECASFSFPFHFGRCRPGGFPF